jgi:arylsulfatase A-like enzyme
MFTGRNPHELGVDWLAPLGPSAPTLAEVLRREGYRTGGFVANLLYTTRESGLARGFDVYREHPVTLKHILMSTELGQLLRYPRRRAGMIRNYPRKPAEVVNREFLEWLGEPRADRPFFAFLNYFDAHVPYHAPDSLRGAFRSGNWSLDMYETAIAYLDGEMDALLRELERRGVLDETVVIITSDHGEQFGAAHGLGGHGNSLYMQLVHVPLVMIHPGLPGGLRIEGPVALRDLAATVLDLADVSDGTLLPGLSLARLWSEEGAVGPVEPVLSTVTPTFRPKPVERNARGELRSLVLERFHYILNPDGTEELFDFREDPREERNLVARDEGSATELSEPAELAELRRRMREIDMQHPRKTPGSEGGKNRM